MKSKVLAIFFLLILTTILVSGQNITNNQNKLDSKLTEPVKNPYAQTFSKVIFNLSPGASLNLLVIATCSWLFVFFALICSIGIFYEGYIKWAISFLVTMLVSVSGGIREGAEFILSFQETLAIIAKSSAGALFFIIVITAVLILVIPKITKTIRAYNRITKAYAEGMKAGANQAYIKQSRKYS